MCCKFFKVIVNFFLFINVFNLFLFKFINLFNILIVVGILVFIFNVFGFFKDVFLLFIGFI